MRQLSTVPTIRPARWRGHSDRNSSTPCESFWRAGKRLFFQFQNTEGVSNCCIFLIVALTFKSLIIPLILVLLVQCGVYITVSVTSMMGGNMYYLALLIVECILMGATIDYGILLTNYYREARASMDVKDALKAAYAGSTHTILTSGLILILVTAIVGNFFDEATIAAIVKTISIGALCATLLILFVLPGVLACCDRLIVKKKNS